MIEKDIHIEKLETLLDDWNAEYDELETRIRMAGGDSKRDDDVITALRQRRSQANTKPEKIQKESKNVWKDLRRESGKTQGKKFAD
jgi:hypothetical protein